VQADDLPGPVLTTPQPSSTASERLEDRVEASRSAAYAGDMASEEKGTSAGTIIWVAVVCFFLGYLVFGSKNGKR
jgi:hypothetical protein